VIVTDKLKSYAAGKREILPRVEHRQSRYLNNCAEVSHQPTRRREGQMKRFKSAGHAHRFPLHPQPDPQPFPASAVITSAPISIVRLATPPFAHGVTSPVLRQLDTPELPFSAINIRPIGNLTTPFSSLRSWPTQGREHVTTRVSVGAVDNALAALYRPERALLMVSRNGGSSHGGDDPTWGEPKRSRGGDCRG
jgi:DDE domain